MAKLDFGSQFQQQLKSAMTQDKKERMDRIRQNKGSFVETTPFENVESNDVDQASDVGNQTLGFFSSNEVTCDFKSDNNAPKNRDLHSDVTAKTNTASEPASAIPVENNIQPNISRTASHTPTHEAKVTADITCDDSKNSENEGSHAVPPAAAAKGEVDSVTLRATIPEPYNLLAPGAVDKNHNNPDSSGASSSAFSDIKPDIGLDPNLNRLKQKSPGGEGQSSADWLSSQGQALLTDDSTSLMQRQSKVLVYLLEAKKQLGVKPLVVNQKKLADLLDLSHDSVRRAFCELERMGFLTRRTYRRGEFRGVRVNINHDVCKKISIDNTNKDIAKITHNVTCDAQLQHLDTLKPDEVEVVASFQRGDYPNLVAIGVTLQDIYTILMRGRAKRVSKDIVKEHLDMADFLSTTRSFLSDPRFDAKPEQMRKYILSCLGSGSVPLPEGYKTPEERAVESRRILLERKRRVKDEKRMLDFELWLEEQSLRTLAEILGVDSPPNTTDDQVRQELFNYYIMNVDG